MMMLDDGFQFSASNFISSQYIFNPYLSFFYANLKSTPQKKKEGGFMQERMQFDAFKLQRRR